MWGKSAFLVNSANFSIPYRVWVHCMFLYRALPWRARVQRRLTDQESTLLLASSDLGYSEKPTVEKEERKGSNCLSPLGSKGR